MQAEMEAVAEKLRAQGRKVYLIPGGGSNATGALGYVNCAFELVSQANDRGMVIDHLVTATGSAGTQAGLITGLKAINAGIPLTGIGVRAPKEKQEESVYNLALKTAEKLGCPNVVARADVVELPMSVDEALKYIISMGVVVPPLREPRPGEVPPNPQVPGVTGPLHPVPEPAPAALAHPNALADAAAVRPEL